MSFAMCCEGCTCAGVGRSEEHTSELQSQSNLVCRLLLEKKKQQLILACRRSLTPFPTPPLAPYQRTFFLLLSLPARRLPHIYDRPRALLIPSTRYTPVLH